MDAYLKDLDGQIMAINARVIKACALVKKGNLTSFEEFMIKKLIRTLEDQLDTLLAMRMVAEKQL